MKRRSAAQTVVKSIKRMLSTDPRTWLWRWKVRNIRVAKTRQEYLDEEPVYSDDELLIGGRQVMQAWERPLMRALAEQVTRSKGDVLEVGFGMGISASYLIEAGCSSYTVIEPHPGVLRRAREWAPQQPVPVHIEEGFWEDRINGLGEFDGILFDTYPVTKDEDHAAMRNNQLIRDFAPHASRHLRPGGAFTFYSSHASEFPPDELKFLQQHFDDIRISHVSGMTPPKDCQYYHRSEMLVPTCIKRQLASSAG